MSRHCWNCSAVIDGEERYCAECAADFSTIAAVGRPLPHNDCVYSGPEEKDSTDDFVVVADSPVVCMATIVAPGFDHCCSLCGAFPEITSRAYGKGYARQCRMAIGNEESVA